jgi:hypothetical protein
MKKRIPLCVGAIALGVAGWAQASCGSAFCGVNTTWDAQGVWSGEGTVADLRFETVNQNRLKSGTSTVSPSAVSDPEVPLYTRNRNLLLTLDRSLSPQWGIALQAPLAARVHESIVKDPVTGPSIAKWDFARLGDARVTLRYRFADDIVPGVRGGLRLGVKLPTGSHTVANEAGDVADRALQPGTGTTDLILGANANGGDAVAGWFAQATLTAPANSRDLYRPPRQLGFDAGWRMEVSTGVTAMLQVNLQAKGRETGANSQNADSGGRFAWLSPGGRMEIDHRTSAYGFIQIPLYQRVNGVQTVDRGALMLGLTRTY